MGRLWDRDVLLVVLLSMELWSQCFPKLTYQASKGGDTMENEKDPELEKGTVLDDEVLEHIAGGTLGPVCPGCGGTNIEYVGANVSVCRDCGYGG